MYRLLIKKCDKPHNITGRVRYRIGLCYEAMNGMRPVFKNKNYSASFLILSPMPYRSGVFVNPTKVLKQYLKERVNHG